MPTRKEHAQKLVHKPYSDELLTVVFTGRVLAVGNLDEEIPSTLGDPTAISTIIPELTPLGKVLTTIVKQYLKKDRAGHPAMTYAEMLERQLEVNKKSFKQRSDVTIFEKNGEVKINA